MLRRINAWLDRRSSKRSKEARNFLFSCCKRSTVSAICLLTFSSASHNRISFDAWCCFRKCFRQLLILLYNWSQDGHFILASSGMASAAIVNSLAEETGDSAFGIETFGDGGRGGGIWIGTSNVCGTGIGIRQIFCISAILNATLLLLSHSLAEVLLEKFKFDKQY